MPGFESVVSLIIIFFYSFFINTLYHKDYDDLHQLEAAISDPNTAAFMVEPIQVTNLYYNIHIFIQIHD